MAIADGRCVSTSFIEWTAQSISPPSSARSSSLVQSALPPISASGRSWTASPGRPDHHDLDLDTMGSDQAVADHRCLDKSERRATRAEAEAHEQDAAARRSISEWRGGVMLDTFDCSILAMILQIRCQTVWTYCLYIALGVRPFCSLWQVVASIHAFANPARFLKLARRLTPWTLWSGVAMILVGTWAGLTQTPPGLSAGRDGAYPVHPRAGRVARYGRMERYRAVFAGLSDLASSTGDDRGSRPSRCRGRCSRQSASYRGSIWGRPTWGTWWEWDGRLTSMLLLFFVYLGFMALARADADRGGDGRIPALYGVAGSVLLPIIRYSVVVVEHASSGPEHRFGQVVDRFGDPVAVADHVGGRDVVLHRDRPHADACDRRADQARRRDCAAWQWHERNGDMNPWPFVIAAYVVTLVGGAGLAIASWRAMRAAERRLP